MRKTNYQLELAWLLVTRGAAGMCMLGKRPEPVCIPTRARQVFDASGAGCTVIVMFALSAMAGVLFADAARLANLAAGVVVDKAGTQLIEVFKLQIALRYSGLAQNGTFQRLPRRVGYGNSLRRGNPDGPDRGAQARRSGKRSRLPTGPSNRKKSCRSQWKKIALVKGLKGYNTSPICRKKSDFEKS